MGLSPKQWERVKDLYETALECSPSQRTAFLRKNAKDEIVHEEVRRLLAEHDKSDSFLSTPPFIDPRFSSTDSPERLGPGDFLAERFRIVNFIAAGGMGEVYKAEDTRLARTVVLKFLPKKLAEDPQSLGRFRREAKAASALNHPNICTIYDFGEDAGRAFIAMEYLEGETLAERIKKGPLPLNEALKIAIPVAVALGTAHHKGIIHRDLKPGNIMLTATGAKLLDFGLARFELHEADDDVSKTPTQTGDTQVFGTPPYMSPEQLRGTDAGSRGDVFAFGAVLYEMLAGRRAFQGRSNADTLAAVEREEPRPLQEFRKDVPNDLERIIRRCLQKRPEERYASVSEIERDLEDCALASGVTGGFNLRALFLQSKRPRVAIFLLIILLTMGSLCFWWLQRSSRVRWARDQALPQIAQLIEKEKLREAYALAVQAERYIPNNPQLAKFWPSISWSGSINTTPPGVSVFRRNYNTPNNAWELVGRSPIENRRFALVDSQWKFELNGYATVERATFPADSLTVTMDEEAKAPSGMVHVEFPTSAELKTTPVTLFGLPGFEDLPAVPLGNYWIDKYEVTNKQFKEFLDQGGYQKQEYWKHKFRKDGRALSWTEAMALFRDTTGRSGPATWVQGKYPPGEEDFPVTGASWFEAAAFAEFSGKSLPTLYQWTIAASPGDSPSMIPASNFSGRGPARVGSYHGMSWSGAYDMAGNVKEWCWNEATDGKRYIMGGASDEPTYMFNDADARSPFERFSNFGFRLAKDASTGDDSKASNPVTVETRDFSRERPVSDPLYQAYKSLFSYDKTALHAVIESTEQTDDWKREKITFAAAYGNERNIAYLFLPEKASLPLQTVIYFPGASAVRTRTSEITPQLDNFDFIIKSGRAVMFPLYKGTYERGDGTKRTFPNTTSFYRDHVIAWSKDLGRSIDYLETRSDIDHNKLAYQGASWGAAMGALLPAVDERLKALVLVAPGFYLQRCLPEVDQLNFAPRMKTPVLMLNGRFDFIFPTGTSQEPMFRSLGTPKEDKRRVIYETGHDIPRDGMIKETLDWLDRYLGPVK